MAHRATACRDRSHGADPRCMGCKTKSCSKSRSRPLWTSQSRWSQCPRSPALPDLLFVLFFLPRTWWNSWWKCQCCSRSSGHEAGTQLALIGATSLRGGGVYWWMTGTRHVMWDPPKGFTASPGRNTNTGQERRADDPVMMQLEFQQSFETVEMPQIQFLDRLPEFQL